MNKKPKKLYHLSLRYLGPKVLFEPRIPDNRFEGDFAYHPYLGEYIEEDDTVPRICTCPTIKQCLLAVPFFNHDKLFVYCPQKPIAVTKDMPKYLVPDFKVTNETWILNPTVMLLRGQIQKINDDGKYKWISKNLKNIEI